MSSMSDEDSFSEHGQQMLDDAKSSINKNVEHATAFVKTRSKTFWMVLAMAMVVLIGSLIYEWWRVSALWKRYINCPGCYMRFHNKIADCSDKRPVLRKHLTKPQNGYTYSMWMYVVDWYSNSFGNWKSVYYRGEKLEGSNGGNCSVTWNSIAKQQPGVWLSDTHNNLRVAVTTTVNLPTDCLSGSAPDTTTTPTPTPTPTTTTTPTPTTTTTPTPTTTPTTTPSNQCYGTSTADTKDMNVLEYAEITDFPIGEWFQLLFVVTQRRLELYLNGKLVKTTVFTGEYRDDMCATENGHFASTGHTFRGRVLNFRYMPHSLPYQMIHELYQYESKNRLLKLHDPMDELNDKTR